MHFLLLAKQTVFGYEGVVQVKGFEGVVFQGRCGSFRATEEEALRDADKFEKLLMSTQDINFIKKMGQI